MTARRPYRAFAARALLLGFLAGGVLVGASAAAPPDPAPGSALRFASRSYESGESAEVVRLLVDDGSDVAHFETGAPLRGVLIVLEARCQIVAPAGGRLAVRFFVDGEATPADVDTVLCRSAAGAEERWETGRASVRLPHLPAGFHAVEAEVQLDGSTGGYFRVERKDLLVELPEVAGTSRS